MSSALPCRRERTFGRRSETHGSVEFFVSDSPDKESGEPTPTRRRVAAGG